MSTVTIIGATGVQGGSVVDTLLKAGGYKLRALTRDPTKDAAKKLAEQGVEVIKGDITSSSDLEAAFKGSDAVFAVTNFWAHGSGNQELEDGKRMADAAKAVGVKHFVYSSLVSSTKASKGKYTHVEHFDAKASVEDYVRSLGIPASFVMPAGYFENFTTMMAPRKQPDGSFVVAFPISKDTVWSSYSASMDTGKFVHAALKQGPKSPPENILAVEYEGTFGEFVEEWGKELGVKVTYQQIPADVFKSFIPQGADELYEMLAFIQDFGYYGGLSSKASKAILLEPATTWPEFIKKTDWSKILN